MEVDALQVTLNVQVRVVPNMIRACTELIFSYTYIYVYNCAIMHKHLNPQMHAHKYTCASYLLTVNSF